MLTMTNIRSVMGSMDLDQVLSHRDEINERLLRVVDAAVSPWGLKVNRIEIKDIVPPADLVEAMGRQMKAERVKRADILQAEGQRQSEILRAEGAKQSQILQAEGRREAAFRDAEARERSAEAEAKATQMVSEAIAKGDVASLNYFIADKYIKAFGQLANSPNQKIIMLPIEATEHPRLARRHRRDRQGDFGESAASARPRRAVRAVPSAGPTPPVTPLALNEGEGHTMAEMLRRTFGTWNWLILGIVLMVARSCWRRACSCSGSASPRCWSGCCRSCVDRVLADADPDVCGVRARGGAAVAAVRAQQFERSRAIRSSTAARMRWSAACSRWKSRSSTAPARCGSTTRSGASPARMCRPAAGSRSCRPMARA